VNKDPKQMNNLLGDVVYGQGYGNFVRHASKQLPELAPIIKKLDNRINVLLEQTDGQRRPRWNKN
jgi:hypothetical protein